MIFVAELQRASKRTDALLCAERLSFIPTISLSLFCGAHELIYPTFICWHNKTRCTLVQIARRSDNCALPTCFLSLGWCLSESMRVTHQMRGRVGGRRHSRMPTHYATGSPGQSSAAALFNFWSRPLAVGARKRICIMHTLSRFDHIWAAVYLNNRLRCDQRLRLSPRTHR